MKKTAALLTALFCVSLAGCSVLKGVPAEGISSRQTRLTMTGSTAMTTLCQTLGESFSKKYPEITVEKNGAGSGEAPGAVRSGMADLGDISRPLTGSEHPEEFTVVPVAADVIVIAVHRDNPVTSLSLKELKEIFSGKIENWAELGGEDRPVTCVGRESASGTRDCLERKLGISSGKYDCEFSSTGEVVTRVGSDPCAVGYCSIASLNPSVRPVALDGVVPSLESAAKGEYPLVMELIQIYRKGDQSELLERWFSFVRSPEGQELILRCGLLPRTEAA